MANEKRLVDANVFIRDLTAMKSVYDAIALDGMIKALNEAPAVDAVEVVRCKDCQRFAYDKDDADYYCTISTCVVGHNDFCSYGKRKDGDGDG